MAEIKFDTIEMKEVVRGDMLDRTYLMQHNLDIAGKKFYAEVREDMDTEIVLKFEDKDNNSSLVVDIISDTSMTFRFNKKASEMNVSPAAYQISVIMGTAPEYEDKQTIIRGTMTVVKEITKKPTV